MQSYTFEPIAHIETNLSGKFGLPRQFGVIPDLCGKIVFRQDLRNTDALRGLEEFSHIWVIWVFSESEKADRPVALTVRPPRLGGNIRKGIFATRSPYRPNNIGMSALKIEKIELDTPEGPVIWVSGVDLMNGTPILDIKPYIPYSDSIVSASHGFTSNLPDLELEVVFPEELLKKIPPKNQEELISILHHDMRPQYQHDNERVYGLTYLDKDIKFTIEESDDEETPNVLTVNAVVPRAH